MPWRRMLRSTTAMRSISQFSAYCEISSSIFPSWILVPRTSPSVKSRTSRSTGWRVQNSSKWGTGEPSSCTSS
jgi:hypothetical protein